MNSEVGLHPFHSIECIFINIQVGKIMRTFLKWSLLTGSTIILLFGLSGCGEKEEGTAEKAGKAIDKALKEGGDSMKEAGEAIKESTEE